MEEAIKKAIEGGWVLSDLIGQMNYGMSFKLDIFGRNRLWCWDDVGNEYWLNENDALIDPLFWQALGKALGGYKEVIKKSSWVKEYTRYRNYSWKVRWHNFIDHLAEGKPTDDFFNELLK